jgi:hypothetical protein
VLGGTRAQSHTHRRNITSAVDVADSVGFFVQMAISDDQRAMLQLLLQRGQSYSDIGSLLGLEDDQVRERARTALTEIGGEDPDRDVSLTDYLLGQADPIGRADAARHLQSDADARELAERLQTQLRVLAPGAEFPELPGADSRPAKQRQEPAPAKPAPAPASGSKQEPAVESTSRSPLSGLATTLSKRQRRVIAGLLGGGLVIVVIVLAVAGVFSGGGGGNDTTTSSSSGNSGSQQASNNASGLTRALLTAQNGGKAQGVAVFAQVRNTPVLQINVTGLTPTKAGQRYVIWLYGGPSRAFPLVRQPVGKNGQMRGAAPVPTQLIQALGQGLFKSVDVSLSTDAEITAALQQARKTQQLPRYAGTSVVRGTITGPGFSSSSGSGGSSG